MNKYELATEMSLNDKNNKIFFLQTLCFIILWFLNFNLAGSKLV